MKTFYCVQTRFFDNGNVKAICYPVEETEKPKNFFYTSALSDVYCDYFDTYAEAKDFQKRSLSA